MWDPVKVQKKGYTPNTQNSNTDRDNKFMTGCEQRLLQIIMNTNTGQKTR